MSEVVHYIGPTTTARVRKLGGWAACASGSRAYSIRNGGMVTIIVRSVTCKSCLRRIEASDAYADAQIQAAAARMAGVTLVDENGNAADPDAVAMIKAIADGRA